MVRSLFHVWSIMNTLIRSITKDLLERNRSFDSVCVIAWPKDLFYLVWYLLSINLFTGLITDLHEQYMSFLIWNLHFKLGNSPMCKLGPVSRKVEIDFIYWLNKALNWTVSSQTSQLFSNIFPVFSHFFCNASNSFKSNDIGLKLQGDSGP